MLATCIVQCTPQMVQDGAAQAAEDEEECPRLPGQLCNPSAQSGLASTFLLTCPFCHFASAWFVHINK